MSEDHDAANRKELREATADMQPPEAPAPQGSTAEVMSRFRYKAPSQEGVFRHERLTNVFQTVAEVVRDVVPPGREQSLVLTKLEEAKMWASAGVARNPETR